MSNEGVQSRADTADQRYVLHLTLPNSMEAYFQVGA